MSNAPRFIIAGKELCLGPDGKAPSLADGPLQFDFTYRSIRFAARYDQCPLGLGTLKLVGDCGPMPFSAESPQARITLGTILAEANDVLGPVFKVTQGRILVGGESELDAPLTAVSLVAASAAFLLPVDPYLDLLAIVVRPPLEPHKPGEPALRAEWRRRAR